MITVALDFDGTVVEHRYPEIGKEAEGAVDVMKKWADKYNVGFILDTMRDGKELEDAIHWFDERGIALYGVGRNPTQHKWTSSPKCHAHFSIDDRNIGCPMNGEVVDWKAIDEMMSPYFDKITENLTK